MWMENDDNPFNFDENLSDLSRRLEKEKLLSSLTRVIWALALGACLKFSKCNKTKESREKGWDE